MPLPRSGRPMAAVFCLVLGACGHMPLSTMYQLRNFDAATADPAVLRVAVRIPDTLEPRTRGVKLTVSHWRDGEVANKQTHDFVLQETATPAERAELAGHARPGTRTYAFRVDPADVARIRAIQAETREARRDGRGKSHGTFGVTADTCRVTDLAETPVLMTTFLKTDARAGYLVLLENVDLREVIPKDKTFDDVVPACAMPASPRR